LVGRERNPLKVALSFVIALLAMVIIFVKVALRRPERAIPFDGMVLVFWHSFQERERAGSSNFIALEIDSFRVSGPHAYVTIFLISNSGLRTFRGRIEIETRRVIEFQGREGSGMYAVFWAPRPGQRPMIYDLEFTAHRALPARYFGRERRCLAFRGRREGASGVEEFSIRYCDPQGLELDAFNRGWVGERQYVEIYRLIYDNAGL